MQMVHVILRGISREAKDQESAGARLARLLHSERAPHQDCFSTHAERPKNRVGRFRCADECTWKYFGMSDQELLL